MESTLTIRQVTERVVELGLVDAATVVDALEPAMLDSTLDYFGVPDDRAVLRLLSSLGIWYDVDPDAFRGVCEDGPQLYEEQLRLIADRTRGLITITDVDVVDDEAGGHHVLRFRSDGEPREWRITHDEDEDEEEFDAVMTFSMRIHELVPAGSPARWCTVKIDDGAYGPQAVFGDPEALRQLGAEFGLTFWS